MASRALVLWDTDSAVKLNELVSAHRRIGGTGRGRRYATEQLNASLAVQVAAHFQLFCRNLHSEAAELLVAAAPTAYRPMLRLAFTNRRGLDRGNASTETTWRNAVAHQDFVFSPHQQRLLSGSALTFQWAGRWRSACDGLARTFDSVVAAHLAGAIGRSPW